MKTTHRYFRLVSSLNASEGTSESLLLSRYLRLKTNVKMRIFFHFHGSLLQNGNFDVLLNYKDNVQPLKSTLR